MKLEKIIKKVTLVSIIAILAAGFISCKDPVNNTVPESNENTNDLSNETLKFYSFVFNDDILSKTQTDDEIPVPIVHDGNTNYIFTSDGKIYFNYSQSSKYINSAINPDGTFDTGITSNGFIITKENSKYILNFDTLTYLEYTDNKNFSLSTDGFLYIIQEGSLPYIYDIGEEYHLFKEVKLLDSNITLNNVIKYLNFDYYSESLEESVYIEINDDDDYYSVNGSFDDLTISGIYNSITFEFEIIAPKSLVKAKITKKNRQQITYTSDIHDFAFAISSSIPQIR